MSKRMINIKRKFNFTRIYKIDIGIFLETKIQIYLYYIDGKYILPSISFRTVARKVFLLLDISLNIYLV
jgi:hypothetical protein